MFIFQEERNSEVFQSDRHGLITFVYNNIVLSRGNQEHP